MHRLVLACLLLLALAASACASTTPSAATEVQDPPPKTVAATTTTEDEPETITTTEAPESDDDDDVEPEEPPVEEWLLLDGDKRAETPDSASRYVVTYYGDSLASSAQEWVGTYLDLGGRIRFRPSTFPGSAICDWNGAFERDIARFDIWATVILFSNNTFTDCMKDDSGEPLNDQAAIRKFRVDLNRVIELFEDEGTTVYLPTIPESRGDIINEVEPSLLLNRIFAESADKYDHVLLVDAAAAVLDENGRYTETLPCLPVEPCTGGVDENGVPVNLVREWDGVHFCSGGYAPNLAPDVGNCPSWSSGAYRYAGALTAPIIEAAQKAWVTDNPPAKIFDPIVTDRPTE